MIVPKQAKKSEGTVVNSRSFDELMSNNQPIKKH